MKAKHLLFLLLGVLVSNVAAGQNEELHIPLESDNQFPPEDHADTAETAIEDNGDVVVGEVGETTTELPPITEDLSTTLSEDEKPSTSDSDTDCPQPCICNIDVGSNNFTVDCSGFSLTEFPSSIDPKTTTLYLQNNQLTDIPKEVSALKNLKVLNANNNEIMDLALGSISELPELVTLKLANNRLTEYPEDLQNSITLTKLQELDLGGNEIQTKLDPAAFIQFKALKTLTLTTSTPEFLDELCATFKETLKTICTESCELEAYECPDTPVTIEENVIDATLPGIITSNIGVEDSNLNVDASSDNKNITTQKPQEVPEISNTPEPSTVVDTLSTKQTQSFLLFEDENPLKADSEFACPKPCVCNIVDSNNVTVNCSGYGLTEFPSSLDLKTTTLYLQDNKLTDIPKEVSTLRNLKVLNVNNNEIMELAPGSISELPELVTLKLANNQLIEYPKDLQINLTLNKLQELDIGGNEMLTSLTPDLFLPLKALKILTLTTSTPEVLDELCATFKETLKTVCTESCEAKAYECPDKPKQIEEVVIDATLSGNITSNIGVEDSDPGVVDSSNDNKTITTEKSQEVPESRNASEPLIAVNTSSTERIQSSLLLENENPSKADSEFACPKPCLCNIEGNSTNFTVDCAGYGLTELPSSIDTKTTTLYLQNNNLTDIPEKLSVLKNLKVLNANNNEIIEVAPGSISELPELVTLKLANNRLTEYPKDLQNSLSLTKLQELDLGGNDKLTKLTPDLFLQLKALKKLTVATSTSEFLDELCATFKETLDTVCTESCDAQAYECKTPENIEEDLIDATLPGMIAFNIGIEDSDPGVDAPMDDKSKTTEKSQEVPELPNTSEPSIAVETLSTEQTQPASDFSLRSAIVNKEPAGEVVSNSIVNKPKEETSTIGAEVKIGAKTEDTKTGGVDKSVIGVIVAGMIIVVAVITIKKNWSSIRARFGSSPRPPNSRTEVTANGTAPEEVPLQDKSPV